MDHRTVQLLRKKRNEMGKTQRDIAAEIGCTIEAVVRWEHGRSIPRSRYLPLLAQAYQIDLDTIKAWIGEIATSRGAA